MGRRLPVTTACAEGCRAQRVKPLITELESNGDYET